MKQQLLLITMLYSLFVTAQIIPFSMIDKGHKFAKIQMDINYYTNTDWQGNSFFVRGFFDIKASGRTGVEVGILYLLNSDARVLNIDNASKINFTGGSDFMFDRYINNLDFNTEYKVRAYAKSRLNQIAYSSIHTITTDQNYCLFDYLSESAYCFNGGICESKWGGQKLCHCVDDYGGTRCELFYPPGLASFQETTIGADYSERLYFQNKIIIPSKNHLNDIWLTDK